MKPAPASTKRKDAAHIQAVRTVPAGQFKATCLQLLDRAAGGESITITKRGRVVGRLVPPEEARVTGSIENLIGMLKGKTKVVATLEELTQAAHDGWAGTRR